MKGFRYILFMCVTFGNYTISFSQNWQAIPSSINLNANIDHFFTDTINNRLYVSGQFNSSCPNNACCSFAYWDNISWHYINDSTSLLNPIPLVYYNGKMITANFSKSYSHPSPNANYLAELNGSNWIRTDSTDGSFRNLRVINNKLFAVGLFNSVNGVIAHNIAFKDSLGWHALDSTTWNWSGPITGVFKDVVEYNGSLYVCGWFYSHDNSIRLLAKWDGAQWSNVGGAMFNYAYAQPMCLCVYKKELYMGGQLMAISTGDPGNGIARWNDTIWSQLSSGLSDTTGFVGAAYDMKVINDKLAIAGGFNFAGTVPATNIVEWDGAKFCAFGGRFNNVITTIENYNNQIYAATPADHVDTVSVNYISRWVGGSYRDSCGAPLSNLNRFAYDNYFFIYPNPATNFISLHIEDFTNFQNSIITIQNTLGEVVRKQSFSKTISVSEFPNGCYFIQLVLPNGEMYTTRFIKE